jgi:aminoglycoside phosphotransferase (APT) family kinase protein
LLASGRDSDIFECGDGLVLRRSRTGRSLAGEAQVMEHARRAGFPVPAVEEVSADGTDLVMERIDGPLMLAVIGRRPWELRRQGALLASLHHRLHEIAAPPWLTAAPGPSGDRLVHLDLHPLNVLIGPAGPVLIDWSNAARGDPAADVAVTWMLMATAEVPAGRISGALMGRVRGMFVNSFLAHVDTGAASRAMAQMVDWKVSDPHMSPSECERMHQLASRHPE